MKSFWYWLYYRLKQYNLKKHYFPLPRKKRNSLSLVFVIKRKNRITKPCFSGLIEFWSFYKWHSLDIWHFEDASSFLHPRFCLHCVSTLLQDSFIWICSWELYCGFSMCLEMLLHIISSSLRNLPILILTNSMCYF